MVTTIWAGFWASLPVSEPDPSVLKHFVPGRRKAIRPSRGFLYAAHTVHDRRYGSARPFRDEARFRNIRRRVRAVFRTGLPRVQDRVYRGRRIRGDRDR